MGVQVRETEIFFLLSLTSSHQPSSHSSFLFYNRFLVLDPSTRDSMSLYAACCAARLREHHYTHVPLKGLHEQLTSHCVNKIVDQISIWYDLAQTFSHPIHVFEGGGSAIRGNLQNREDSPLLIPLLHNSFYI